MKAKRETKTNAGGEPQGTAYHVRARMSRGRVGPNVVGARGRSSNHGDVGSTQKETLVDSTEMPRWRQSTVVKARNANMMRKVKGHSKPAMEVPITMAGRLLRPVNGVNNVTTLEGRSDSGNNTSKRSKVTQPKPDTPQKMLSSKDTRMDQPKASSSKRAVARALQLKMQIYYLRWLHRRGVVRQETVKRVGYLLEMQRPNRKST